MTAAEELRHWLQTLRRRLALGAVVRGCAVLAGAALGVTLVVVVVANRYAFSAGSVRGGRWALAVVLALAAVVGLAIPLWRLTRAFIVRHAERRVPQFEARLRTFTERSGADRGPFMELLAADTLRVAHGARPGRLVPVTLLAVLGGIGLASLGTLVWLVRSGPGYLGYGAALVWGAPHGGPLYDIEVSPGDAGIRRHADILINAQTVGLATRDVLLHVRVGHADWQRLPMQPQPLSTRFRYLLSALPDDAEYWVEAGALSSAHYHVHVSDIPVVRQVRVTYHYPAWTGLPDRTEEHGGDVRAVQGTQARLEIVTDQPLTDGALALDDGQRLRLDGAGTRWQAQLMVSRDGAWHVTSREQTRVMRISPDWVIEATSPNAPQVAIVRPTNEYHASPIEEVTIAAQAADDFGLNRFELRWSVNGGPEHSADLLSRNGTRQAHGSTTLSLEDLKLVPGDVVSVYALARDARAEARSDMVFVQADPFEREYSQAQAAGGGGGGGGIANDQAEISRREKEIIAGTWAQLSGREAPVAAADEGRSTAPGGRAAEQATFLSDVQDTLRKQALSLAGRLQMRDLTDANEQFSGFEREMSAAADAMGPAAQQLKGQHWQEAVQAEQQALQHLLRAEATFREIQVAFGSRGAGGGGGMGRDLASLSDLELDTNKNQYETAQQSQPEQQRDARIDEALRKLDELARQQEQLASQQASGKDAAEQRWNQEMLRRNAEELQRQLQQMAGGQQGQQGQAGQQDQQGQQGQQGGPAQGGGRQQAGAGAGGGDAQVAQALQRLQQAQEAMRRAAGGGDAAGARRAAEDLRAALAALQGLQQKQSVARLDDLAQQADRLAARAREQQDQLRGPTQRQQSPGRSAQPPTNPESMVAERQRLADDVTNLTAQLRGEQTQVQKDSREAARRLRDALGRLDEADVASRLQRSADLLRRGFGPMGDPADDDIANDLSQLGEQVRQARAAAASGTPGQDAALEGMQSFSARLSRLDPRQGETGQGDAQGQRGQGGQQGGQGNQRQGGGRGQSGDVGGMTGRVTGPGGGGGGDGYVNGGWNTGDNQASGLGRAAPGVENRGDTGIENRGDSARQRDYDQGLADLAGVRRAVADDPEARKQVDELIQAMQKLDPRRFPGNPELVDELFAQVRGGVDRLELQLGHDPAADRGAVRSVAAPVIPEGYQGAVADYYRRLSRGQ